MGEGDFIRWQGRAIGLLDLDAFFASVEQLDHPEWRGKPVIVGGSSKNRGVVSTASYEAREFGVHSAMPSYQAERLCPQAIWTRGHFARYRELSAKVMAFLIDETPLVEQVSIDEAFFDITPGRYSSESPIAICQRIQANVRTLGITCSIGLGTSKTVAKIASERQKPRGLTVVPPGTEREFLAPLGVRSMSGVGSATAEKLASMGVYTLGQLADYDSVRLERALGVYGPRLALRAAGLEESAVLPYDAPEEVKSVSNERTFSHDLTEAADVRAAILQISGLVGERLRRKGLKGNKVTLKLRTDFQHTHTAQMPLDVPTDDERVFGPVAASLVSRVWNEGQPVRLLGVAISDFGPAPARQMELFSLDDTDSADSPASGDANAARTGRAPKKPLTRDTSGLSKAKDAVRAKFGNSALGYGRDLRLGRLSDKDDA